jgi:hypothetical protein
VGEGEQPLSAQMTVTKSSSYVCLRAEQWSHIDGKHGYLLHPEDHESSSHRSISFSALFILIALFFKLF